MNPLCSPNLTEVTAEESTPRFLKLPPKTRSPSRTPSSGVDVVVAEASPGSGSRRISHIGIACNENHQPNSSPQTNDQNSCIGDSQKDQTSPMLVKLLITFRLI